MTTTTCRPTQVADTTTKYNAINEMFITGLRYNYNAIFTLFTGSTNDTNVILIGFSNCRNLMTPFFNNKRKQFKLGLRRPFRRRQQRRPTVASDINWNASNELDVDRTNLSTTTTTLAAIDRPMRLSL